MEKLNQTRALITDDQFRSDVTSINSVLQNIYGTRLQNEFTSKLKTAKPNLYPEDIKKAGDDQHMAYVTAVNKELGAAQKKIRDAELFFLIENFSDGDLIRAQDFYKAYPALSKIQLSFENFRFFLDEIRAIFTADHKERWSVANDITLQLLKEKPAYVSFPDPQKQILFTNSIINYLTNNYKLDQLMIIRSYLGSLPGQKLMTSGFRIFAERVRVLEEIYKNNYAAFAALPMDQKRDSEFR